MSDQTFSMRKLKELIVYVAQESQEDPHFGAVKLNKILYYADFLSYGENGASITGASYMPLQEGPAPRQMVPALNELLADGDLEIEKRSHWGRTQKRAVALRKANESLFTQAELHAVHEAMERLHGLNATEASDMTHKEVGWQTARMAGEDIPYESVFLSNRPLSAEDVARGQQLADTYGWRN